MNKKFNKIILLLLLLLIILLYTTPKKSYSWFNNNISNGSMRLQTNSTIGHLSPNTYYVNTKEELNLAIKDYRSGDYIYIMSDINYDGDVLFNRPLYLGIEAATLTINGSLIFSYFGSGDFYINTTMYGQIVCNTGGGLNNRGSFYAFIPNCGLHLMGKGDNVFENGDLLVNYSIYDNSLVDISKRYSNIYIKCNNSDGIILDDFNFVFYSNTINNGNLITSYNFASIIFMDNTKLTLSNNSNINKIMFIQKDELSQIEIINNGIINSIYLVNFNEENIIDGEEQIIIRNNNLINEAIYINSYLEKYNKDGGSMTVYYNSNVLSNDEIIVINYVQGTNPFTSQDIIYND